jgi:hypothetical protein
LLVKERSSNIYERCNARLSRAAAAASSSAAWSACASAKDLSFCHLLLLAQAGAPSATSAEALVVTSCSDGSAPVARTDGKKTGLLRKHKPALTRRSCLLCMNFGSCSAQARMLDQTRAPAEELPEDASYAVAAPRGTNVFSNLKLKYLQLAEHVVTRAGGKD